MYQKFPTKEKKKKFVYHIVFQNQGGKHMRKIQMEMEMEIERKICKCLKKQ